MNSDMGPSDEITQEKILLEINFQYMKILYEPYKDLFVLENIILK